MKQIQSYPEETDRFKVKNIEFIYEAPPAGIQESQINALAELFGGMLKKSA